MEKLRVTIPELDVTYEIPGLGVKISSAKLVDFDVAEAISETNRITGQSNFLSNPVFQGYVNGMLERHIWEQFKKVTSPREFRNLKIEDVNVLKAEYSRLSFIKTT